MTKAIDLIGQTFGRLVVTGRADNTRRGLARFHCLCECGTQKVIDGIALRRGLTMSCGCWRREKPSVTFYKHGKKETSEYKSWCAMKTRCLNKNDPAYPRYGGRGITICDEWVGSFESFINDMGPRPPGTSLDRIDFNGRYGPENCRWADDVIQARNRSTVIIIEMNGITDSMAGWARRTGIPYLKLRRRLTDGWSKERALTP